MVTGTRSERVRTRRSGRPSVAVVAAAVGHTEATYSQTRAAIDAGATVATHLFNAMYDHHREPGPVIALLEDPRVSVEIIADGVHVDAALPSRREKRRADRLSLVTDAMAAATVDGDYRIGAAGGGGDGGRCPPGPGPTPSRAAPRRWTDCSDSSSPTPVSPRRGAPASCPAVVGQPGPGYLGFSSPN